MNDDDDDELDREAGGSTGVVVELVAITGNVSLLTAASRDVADIAAGIPADSDGDWLGE